MRPDARIAAAIDILDEIGTGTAAERCLTNWARAHRFAGSGDRAAIRDIVFDALRRKRSYGWLGGGETGRALMVGRLRAEGTPPDTVFTGEGYAPRPLTDAEKSAGQMLEEAPPPVRLDCPDWIWPHFRSGMGDRAEPILTTLRDRAPVFLRVNLARIDRQSALAALAEDDIDTEPHALADTALRVTRNDRRIRASRAFREGLVELQDAASQAVVAACLDHLRGERVLDYCAGGGGKALAFAGGGVRHVTAHDADPARMKDIPARASRAGADIEIVRKVIGRYDLVLCDAPCSGSGAWRRQPEAKWTLDTARLSELNAIQDEVLDDACKHVIDDGLLGYATCSLLSVENETRADAFFGRHPEWREVFQRQWTPLDGGDGFFLALFRKS